MAATSETANAAWNREREQLHAYWASAPQAQPAGAPQPAGQPQPAAPYQWTGQGWAAPGTPHQYPAAAHQPAPVQQPWTPQQHVPQHPHQQAPQQHGQMPGVPGQPGMPGVGDSNETHVTIHPPGKLKHWLAAGAGALVLLAGIGAFALRGGSEDPAATDEAIEEPAESDEEPSPEELAFDDLEDRLDNLEDDEDIIIIDDDNGGYGGYGGGGCCGYGNGGYGNGNGNGNGGIIIGDGANDEGIVIEPIEEEGAEQLIGDDEVGDGEDLVLADSSGADEPVIFPPCNPDEDHSGGDSDAERGPATESDSDTESDSGGGSDGDGGDGASVSFPYTDDFSLGSPAAWAPLSGTWGLTGENYQQTDADSFGNIAELELTPPSEYEAAVEITPIGDLIGGGMLIGQPTPGSRNGATVIDITNDGTFLRWGSYDPDSGEYLYTGGVATPDGFDAATAHTMAVRVESAKTSVLLDDDVVAEFEAVSAGRLGLFTSQSAVAFDNLVISDLSGQE